MTYVANLLWLAALAGLVIWALGRWLGRRTDPKQVKVGDTFWVVNEEHARQVTALLCAELQAEVRTRAFFQRDGTGTLVVTAIEKAPARIEHHGVERAVDPERYGGVR